MRRRVVVVVVVAAALASLFLGAARLGAGGDPAAVPPTSPPPAVARPSATPTPDELRLEEMDVSGSGVVSDGGRLEDLRMTARDVTIGPQGLRAGSLAVDAVVPFDVVAQQVGSGVVISAAEGGEARIVRRIEALGRPVALSGTGRVRAEGGRVVVEPTSVEVGGPDWVEAALGDVADRLLRISEPVEGLPPGLRLDRVRVVPTGFAVRFSGRDVLLGG